MSVSKLEPEEFIKIVSELKELIQCDRCPNNANAREPFIDMAKVTVPEELDLKLFKLGSEEYRRALSQNACRMCIAIQAFMALPKEKQLAFLKSNN